MFITIEGGEGVGKTTQLEAIRGWLECNGHTVVVTREPGGTALAETLRGIVTRSDVTVPALAELLIMFAARISHVDEVIVPALTAGKTVLCDRFTDASYAYQGGGRQLPASQIAALEGWLPEMAKPDLTILLDAAVEVGLERAYQRSVADRFEREAFPFFERVRAAYLERARQSPERFIVVDITAKSRQQVSDELLARLVPHVTGVDHD